MPCRIFRNILRVVKLHEYQYLWFTAVRARYTPPTQHRSPLPTWGRLGKGCSPLPAPKPLPHQQCPAWPARCSPSPDRFSSPGESLHMPGEMSATTTPSLPDSPDSRCATLPAPLVPTLSPNPSNPILISTAIPVSPPNAKMHVSCTRVSELLLSEASATTMPSLPHSASTAWYYSK